MTKIHSIFQNLKLELDESIYYLLYFVKIGCIIQKRYLQSGQGKSEQVAVCSVSPTHLAPVKTGSVQVRVRLVVPKNLENIL